MGMHIGPMAHKAHLRTAAHDPDFIEIAGAREHNLDIPRLQVPKRKMVVLTGVSGSGKSSLAFDTLYAEGRRRYAETLSSYARQFLGQLERPHVDHLRGLSPTIAIEQKSASSNPRSTVGTITEIYDYLRVLWARVGEQHCHVCGKPVRSQTAEDVARDLTDLPSGTNLIILSPLVTERKGEHKDLFEDLRSRGFARVVVDGETHRLDEPFVLDKKKKHSVSLVADRITVGSCSRARLVESVELALREGGGELRASTGKGKDLVFSELRTCCGHGFAEPSPQSFSFNSPLGMCETCNGLGERLIIDESLVVADPSLSIRSGAIAPWVTAMQRGDGWGYRIAQGVAKACNVDLDTPWNRIGKKAQRAILYGTEGRRISIEWKSDRTGSHGTWGVAFEGVIPAMMRRFHQTHSEAARDHYRAFMSEQPCDACGGRRLRPESLHVMAFGKSIADVTSLTVKKAHALFSAPELSAPQMLVARGALREIVCRLEFLLNVGLDYLTLGRSGPSLSGGEAQRIRLASQLGSELSGVIYVLDEPSIGLHQRDNRRLIETLRRLRDLGNTVIVVEHDEGTIRSADHVIDFGPGAGHLGGKVVFAGTVQALERDRTSLTGAYLAGRKRIEVPTARRTARGALWVRGASEHNLKGIDVRFPLGVLVAVTGVSGAGKSSLVSGILLPALSRRLHGSRDPVGAHRTIEGLDQIDKIVAIDQKPIGRTPRSNPGTYTKAFDQIREIFAQVPDARARGYDAGRFSFNVKGGRCEACGGDGVVEVAMHFLPDVYVPCEACKSRRYNDQTLAVRFKGLSIADVLDRSVDECMDLFRHHVVLGRILKTLGDVGLGYMKIGQSAPTLSGGEAQRVKLSRELGKVQTGRTLYVLDEPTTGLHFDDIKKLLGVLYKLVDTGNTVVVIEHNLDVVKCADWVIDLGPGGGDAGGMLVAEGTPEALSRARGSFTGRFLRPHVKQTRG
jgi:excinuclease ABC subunit A